MFDLPGCVFLDIPKKVFANSGSPDQTPHCTASDRGMHCSSGTLFGVSRLKLQTKMG